MCFNVSSKITKRTLTWPKCSVVGVLDPESEYAATDTTGNMPVVWAWTTLLQEGSTSSRLPDGAGARRFRKSQTVQLAGSSSRSLRSRDARPSRAPRSAEGPRSRGPAAPTTGRRRGSGAGKRASLADLPVFYFNRIRVGRLHFHLHLSHDGLLPGPGGRDAWGREPGDSRPGS